MQTYYYYHQQYKSIILVSHIDNTDKVLGWFADKGFPNQKHAIKDGTIRIFVPEQLVGAIKNKFTEQPDPNQLTTYTEYLPTGKLKLVVPNDKKLAVINYMFQNQFMYDIGHGSSCTIITTDNPTAIARITKKYPPINQPPQPQPAAPQPTPQPANADTVKSQPTPATPEALTKMYNRFSHFRLNRIALSLGLGDLSDLSKQNKVEAIVATITSNTQKIA